MTYIIEEMGLEHFDAAMGLWKTSSGVKLSEVDSRDNIGRLLERNPGLSYVALEGEKVVGAVLCSHDGRLGYLTHLVVDPEYRRQGIGRSLVGRCVFALMRVGISKCALLIMADHEEARKFWENTASDRVEMVTLMPKEECERLKK